MIELHCSKTPGGPVSVTLDRTTGQVSYRKAGAVQTLVDSRGRNLSPFVEKAVALLVDDKIRRVLVLGHGGGAASRLLHKKGVEVVSVDCDPCAYALGKLFFRAPPSLKVVVDEAASYVANAEPASFDAILVDFQDQALTPAAYLSPTFWIDLARLLRSQTVIVTRITSPLYLGDDWKRFRDVLAQAGLESRALSAAFADGDRLLVSFRSCRS